MFTAVKRATVWPDKRLMANHSDETQCLGHRHCIWRHDGYTCVWDTNCHWAHGVTRCIMASFTLATAVIRINNERCVFCGRETFRAKLGFPRASVSVSRILVARPHSGRFWRSLTFRRYTLQHRGS